MPGPESRSVQRTKMPHAFGQAVLLPLALFCMLLCLGAADVPQKSQQELDEMSTDIVLGMVESRAMTETLDPASWQDPAHSAPPAQPGQRGPWPRLGPSNPGSPASSL